MEIKRKPFQGLQNIIRFNWHFYLIAFVGLVLTFFFAQYLPNNIKSLLFLGAALASTTMIVSALISYYIYDISDLYKLPWLDGCSNKTILNISAGFDETSEFIQGKFENCDLKICDFYDPEKHTEVSIKRARAAYPPPAGTISVTTTSLPFQNNTFDKSLAILSAHEIRNEKERIMFFEELKRVTKDDGQIYVTEHLRDFNNFIAYTIGFLHFHSRPSWLKTFKQANLRVTKEIKTTAFISTFILQNHGTTN